MILLVDNNDSFTYNIVDLLGRISLLKVEVVSSSCLELHNIERYKAVILSPGPSLPHNYPQMQALLKNHLGKIPILGICLGHQAICQHFGSSLTLYCEPLHGVESKIMCDSNSVLFKDIDTMSVGRYHSWVVGDVSETLRVTARDEHGGIMAVENRGLKIFGVQFHPESYISQQGEIVLKNFLKWSN